MKIQVSLGIGLAGAYREDVLEIPNDELVGMSDEEKENYIDEVYVQEWVNNYIDVGYEVIEE